MKKIRTSTPDRLLAAAEDLFAERGYDAVSVREVARRAGANLAAVGYHYGSKERLFAAALAHRARPLNARRLAQLEALQARAGTPTLREVLDAFARAMVEEAASGTPSGQQLHRLVSRAFAEADEVARMFFREEMLPVALKFLAAIRRACPGLSERRAGLGMAQFAGAVVHTLRWAAQPPIPGLAPVRGAQDAEELLVNLLDFGEAGFRALAGAGGAGRGRRARS